MEKYCPKCFAVYSSDVEFCPDDGAELKVRKENDLTGQVVDGRYTILGRLGKGGMGVVYRAEQKYLKRVVALKLLRNDTVQDESSMKRFLNEARAIAALTSRHTITVHDFGMTSEGQLYYTMELLEGKPLSKIIAREAPLDHLRAVRLIEQVCDSLEEAHARGILHRDIKPDNIFVIQRKGEEEAKVLDFGIAKLVGDLGGSSVTKTGMIVGTPQYLSPEQAVGDPAVPASDLYSLGIVLYEMLSGNPPFTEETPLKTLWAHIKTPVPKLGSSNPQVEVPESLERFILQALAKDPKHRFQTVEAFRKGLQQALKIHDKHPGTVELSALSSTELGVRVTTKDFAPAAADDTEVLPPREETSIAPPVSVSELMEVEGQESGPLTSLRSQTTQDNVSWSDMAPPPTMAKPRMRLYAGVGVVVLVGLLMVWSPWSKEAVNESSSREAALESALPVPGADPVTRESAGEDVPVILVDVVEEVPEPTVQTPVANSDISAAEKVRIAPETLMVHEVVSPAAPEVRPEVLADVVPESAAELVAEVASEETSRTAPAEVLEQDVPRESPSPVVEEEKVPTPERKAPVPRRTSRRPASQGKTVRTTPTAEPKVEESKPPAEPEPPRPVSNPEEPKSEGLGDLKFKTDGSKKQKVKDQEKKELHELKFGK